MRQIKNIGCCIIAVLAVKNACAQVPRFRDLPPQQYYITKTITPLPPDIRATSGLVPPNIYGQVTTIAGNGQAGLVNEKGNNARFNNPLDVKQDALGNLFVADAGNNVIRKITPDGTVSTFAGSGVAGFADGTGTAAKFSNPSGLMFDGDGNLYVADRGNQVIRKITPAGVVSVYAGIPGTVGNSNNTMNNPTSLTIDLNGVMYVTDAGNGQVREVHEGYLVPFAGAHPAGTYFGDINGPGARAFIGFSTGSATGPDGNIYITNAELIRKLTPSAVVSTAAGIFHSEGPYDGDSKTAVFQNTFGITIDRTGTMFISDNGNQLIRRFGRKEDFISKLAGSSQGYIDDIGPLAKFNNPAGLCIDANGFVYLADAGNNSIRKISSTGYQIYPALPDGLIFDGRTGIISGTPTKPSPATDYNIFAYNTDGEGQYVVNIQVNEKERQPQTINFGPLPVLKQTDPDYPLTATSTGSANLITYASSDISVASISDGKIHIIGPGTVTITAYKKGDPFYFDATPVPQTLIITEVPPVIVYPTITPKAAPILIPLDGTGHVTIKYTDVATVTGEYQLNQPSVVLAGSDFDCSNIGTASTIIKAGFGPDPIDPLSAKFDHPTSLTFDVASGKMYIADRNYRIRTIGTDGRVGTLAGSGQPGKEDGKPKVAGFGREMPAITTDGPGNVYVVDAANFEVRKVTPDGTVSTFAYDALVPFNDFDPMILRGVAADKANNIYVADRNRVYKVSADGSVAAVFAGSGKENNQDGIGPTADFDGIKGLFFAPDGNLYVSTSDPNDINTIRKITPAGVVTTVFRKTDPLLRFTSMVVDSKGNIFVASTEPKIYKITPDGTLSVYAGSPSRIGRVDGPGATIASFDDPEGVAIDQQDNLYIGDTNNHIIRKITPDDVVTTIAGSGVAGYFDNTSQTNKTSKKINFALYSPITITSTYTPVVIPYLDACPALVPDYTKTATAKSGCTGTFHFTQTPAAGTVLSNGQTVNLVLTATDDLSPYDKASVTFSITANKLPIPTVKITPDYYNSCDGLAVSYTALATDTGSHPGYEWKVNGVTKYNGGNTFTSATLATGDKITCIVTNNDGCAPVSSAPSAPVSLTADPAITTSVTIFSSITTPVCRGSRIDFKAIPANVQSADGGPKFQWRVNEKNVGANNSAYSTTSLSDGDVVTCVMISAGKCVANPVVTSNLITAQILPDGECDVVVPNTFTPNNDGINDYWQIPVLKNYPSSTVSIFNRYGKMIYQSKGYSKPWDGTYNGAQLPAGTYYYIVDPHASRPVVAGWVMILR